MTYKTIVIDAASKAKKLAEAIEKEANERALSGWELVTFSVTKSNKAIVVFRMPEDEWQEEDAQEELVPEASEPEAAVQEEQQTETAEAVGEAE